MALTIGTSFCAQFGEQRAHRGGLHPVIGKIDQRVGDMFVAGEEIGELAAQVERFFQHGWTLRKSLAGRASAQVIKLRDGCSNSAMNSGGTLVTRS